MTSRIALVQTTSTTHQDTNLSQALARVEEAAGLGAGLVAFPEVFLYTGDRQGKLEHAVTLDGPVIERFRQAAQRHRLAICLGSVCERAPEDPRRVYNTSVILGADGDTLGVYRKRNLFDIGLPHLSVRESEFVIPGREPSPVVQTPVGRVGVAICFDLRFPALFQQMRRDGAQIILVPSNFTAQTGADHWEPLLRARAIENQVYVGAPAQVGPTGAGFHSHGHTMLVDPWGTVIAQAPARPQLLVGEIHLDHLTQVRENMPLGF
ncbi:MAG: carbon-nitrogen hydrolase family protein [Deltaproteobacteria bacterium]|nr:carbon-nitrogen hydrolase family protein [Deltaproteobacteria bacterium]